MQDLQRCEKNEITPSKSNLKADDKELEEPDDISENENNVESVIATKNDNKPSKLYYSRKTKHFLRDALPKDPNGKLMNIELCGPK